MTLTRQSQVVLESIPEFHRTRIWSALKALESKAVAEASARYLGDERHGAALYELKIGRVRLRFTQPEALTVVIEEILILASAA